MSSSLSLSFYSSLHRSNQLLKVQTEYHAPLLEQNRQPVLLATQAAPTSTSAIPPPTSLDSISRATAPQQWRALRHCALQDIWNRGKTAPREKPHCREEKKSRGIRSTSRIGSAIERHKNGSSFSQFWACGNIGQWFRELLELLFFSLLPKLLFGSIYWALLEMLLHISAKVESHKTKTNFSGGLQLFLSLMQANSLFM